VAYRTTNPFTGEVLKTFPDATDGEVGQAIDNAHAAFLAWRDTAFSERARVMRNAANLLRQDADAYATILTTEMGKLLSEAKAEVQLSAAIFEYYAANAEKLLADEILPVAHSDEGQARVTHEPLGVLLCIEPWNFPYYQIARIIAPQLSAGNTMLLKHASNVPQSAEAFEKLMTAAGLPDGAFRNLYATRSQIELILNDPRVQGVAGLVAGDPFDPTTSLAPLSSQGAADEVKDKIAEAIKFGAKAEAVGPAVPNHGAFVQPTILTEVGEDNPARYWEFFGPVSMLFRAEDEADAIRIANDSPFGLGGSVFTADAAHGVEVARKISTGMVFVNHPTMVKADLPFGGVRRSGYGRELIGLGIKEFVNHKLIDVVDIDAPF
jgi:acyl-CoA reductase-like NAD-dependent aldehyde dehydrogenase